MIPSGSGGDFYDLAKYSAQNRTHLKVKCVQFPALYRTTVKNVLISGVNAYSFAYADVVSEPLLKFCQIGSQFCKKMAKQEGFAKILAKTTGDLAKNQQNAIRIARKTGRRDIFAHLRINLLTW